MICLLQQFEENLPTYLYGNSMGCQIINTFLLANPSINLSGIIFGSPFFGMAEYLDINPVKKRLIKLIRSSMEPFAMQGSVLIHRVSCNHRHIEKAVTQVKSMTVVNIDGVDNMIECCDCI